MHLNESQIRKCTWLTYKFFFMTCERISYYCWKMNGTLLGAQNVDDNKSTETSLHLSTSFLFEETKQLLFAFKGYQL